jgi:diaminopimelate decarboxylase
MGRRAPVSLRVNPDVDAGTHPYISTGLKGNKFGIPHDQALAAYVQAAVDARLEVVGIDCHIGSQITQIEPYLRTRWTACWTWWTRWKPEASACATSTWAVAWASSTPTNSRRRPTS